MLKNSGESRASWHDMHILRLLAILLALVAEIVEGIANSESKNGVKSS